MAKKKVSFDNFMGDMATQIQNNIEEGLRRRVKNLKLMLSLIDLVEDKTRKQSLNRLAKNEIAKLNEMVGISQQQKNIIKRAITLQDEIIKIEDQINGLLEKKG